MTITAWKFRLKWLARLSETVTIPAESPNGVSLAV
jgi:hypothetical protein